MHDMHLRPLLQIAAQVGLGLPEWYDAGKVSIENSKISFGECPAGLSEQADAEAAMKLRVRACVAVTMVQTTAQVAP
jgi:hypothetical protein